MATAATAGRAGAVRRFPRAHTAGSAWPNSVTTARGLRAAAESTSGTAVATCPRCSAMRASQPQHPQRTPLEPRAAMLGVALEEALDDRAATLAARRRVRRRGVAMAAVEHADAVPAAHLGVLDGAQAEVPVLAHAEARVPRAGEVDDRPREQHRRQPHGELVEQAVDQRCPAGPGRHRPDRLEVLVAEDGREVGQDVVAPVDELEQTRSAVRMQDVVGVDEAQVAPARDGDAGVAPGALAAVRHPDDGEPRIVEPAERRGQRYTVAVVDDDQLDVGTALIQRAARLSSASQSPRGLQTGMTMLTSGAVALH